MGRGASEQLCEGVEESLIYPSAVATLCLTPNFCLSEATPDCLSQFSDSNGSPVEVRILCFFVPLGLGGGWTTMDLGKNDVWIGFGHQNSVFVPTLDSLGCLHLFFRDYSIFGALRHSVYHIELLPKLVEGSWTEEICHIATSGTHSISCYHKICKINTYKKKKNRGWEGYSSQIKPLESFFYTLEKSSAITGPIGKECVDLSPRIASAANAIV